MRDIISCVVGGIVLLASFLQFTGRVDIISHLPIRTDINKTNNSLQSFSFGLFDPVPRQPEKPEESEKPVNSMSIQSTQSFDTLQIEVPKASIAQRWGNVGGTQVPYHRGNDYSVAWHTPLKAPQTCQVDWASNWPPGTYGNSAGYGRTVFCRFLLKDGRPVWVGWGHINVMNVKVGDIVPAGTVIGLSGGDPRRDSNAGYSSGAHTHYEVRMGTVGSGKPGDSKAILAARDYDSERFKKR